MKYGQDYNNYGKFWTQEELDIVRQNFSTLRPAELERLLPERSPFAIHGKGYNLGLHRPPLSGHYHGDFSVNPYSDIKKTDLSYLAGIIDGEGHIYIQYGKRFHVRLIIVNTNKQLIDWIQKIIPETAVYARTIPKHKPQWTTSLTSVYTYHLFKLIMPYLIVKKAKAQEALDLFAGMSKGFSWRDQRHAYIDRHHKS